MKLILTICFVIFIYVSSNAQQSDKVIARVRYTYSSKIDTLKSGKPRKENMLLFLGKNASLYTSYDKITYEIAEDQKSYARAITATGNGGAPKVVKFDKSAGAWLSQSSYFFFNKSKKMFTKEVIVGLSYLLEEQFPELQWKITNDTSTFSGVHCQKATTNFEGKNWIAWFAPSLPFQNGPWKLHGLPGLIVDAFNEDKSVQFQFAGFEKASEGDFTRQNDVSKRPSYQAGDISTVDVNMGLDVSGAYFDNKIELPTYRTARTTKKELERLKEAYAKDPVGFSKAQWGF